MKIFKIAVAIGLSIGLTPMLSVAKEVYDNHDFVQTRDCPGIKPFLKLPDTNTGYYYPELTEFAPLASVPKISIPKRDEFPYESVCKKISDPACDIFNTIHERDKFATEWNSTDTVRNTDAYADEIEKKDIENQKKNEKIKEFQESEMMTRIRLLNGKRSAIHFVEAGVLIDIGDKIYPVQRVPYIYSQLKAETPFQKRAMTYFQALPDFYTKANLTEWEQKRDENLEKIAKTKTINDKIILENQEIEHKNNDIMKQFHDFYTPEKLHQLLNDYDALLKSNCVETMPLEPLIY